MCYSVAVFTGLFSVFQVVSLAGSVAPVPHNEPPELFVERRWTVKSDTKVGDLVHRLVAKDRDGDRLTFSLRPTPHMDGSHIFYVDNTTGSVFMAGRFTNEKNEQYILRVAVSDGTHLTSKEVWIAVIPAAGGGNSSSGSGGSVGHPARPKLPSSVPINNWHSPSVIIANTPTHPSIQGSSSADRSNISESNSTLSVSPVHPPTTTVYSITTEDELATTTTTATSAAVIPSGGETALSKRWSSVATLAPLVATLILIPVLVYAGWRARRVCVQRQLCNKSHSSTMEFEKQFSLGSMSVDKLAGDPSRTWKFDSRGFKPNKLETRRTVSTFSASSCSSNNTAAADSWEFPRHQLRVLSQLGEGCFGQVWKCEALNLAGVSGVSTVAVKTLKESAVDREKSDLLQELSVMKQLGSHPHVVTLLGCCTEKDPLFLIMEYLKGGKLQAYLRESRTSIEYNNLHANSAALSARDLTTFSHQVARGMLFLSENGVIHRDLAARNVLVSEDRVCKVADFGFARNLTGGDVYERKSEGRLPIRWMAPESLYDNIFTVKSDVWSFGVLLWEIVTLGSTPYPGMSAHEVMKRVRDGYRLEKPDHCRRELYNLMYYCWSGSAANRPSFSDIVESLERLLLSETDYIELDRFPEHAYYNLTALSGEKV